MTSRARLDPLPPTIRSLTDEQSRALNARHPSARRTLTTCITCAGTKTFRWRDKTGQPVEYDCPCADQIRLYRWLLNSGVMLNYQRLAWADFIFITPEALTIAGEYTAHAERYVQAGVGMVFTGERGNGKSMLAYLLLKDLIAKGFDCYATTFSDMIDTFAGGWQDREQAQWFNARVRNAGVLMIDDLGRERNRGRPENIGEKMLETVIRSRVSANQPVLITTNLSRDDINAGYGGHTMSLLSEQALTVSFEGQDRREQVYVRKMDEVAAGLTRPIVLS